jgi:hypothetical protein
MIVLARIEQLLLELLGGLFKEALKKVVAAAAELKDAPTGFFVTIGAAGAIITLTTLYKKRKKQKENEA